MRISRAALVVACIVCAYSPLLQSPAAAQPPQASPPASSNRHQLVDVSFHRQRPGPPTVALGNGNPVDVAVDPATRTAYVADADGIDVVDISRCTARVHGGCAQKVTKVPGTNIVTVAIDQVSGTVYAGSVTENVVKVFSQRTCNARDSSGCGTGVHEVKLPAGAGGIAVDEESQTVYVADGGAEWEGHWLTLIDATTCNGQTDLSCGQAAPTVEVGQGSGNVALDSKTRTLYVGNFLSNTVSVLDTQTCNAGTQHDCASRALVPVKLPGPMLADPRTHTLFVTSSGPPDERAALALVDTTACNAQDVSGCTATPPTTPIGTGPIGIDADPGTRTLYVANQNDSNVSVIDQRRCNAQRTDGCRAVAPTMTGDFDAGGVGVDPTTHTVYLSSQQEQTLTALDGNRCNGHVIRGCAVLAPTTNVQAQPAEAAIDSSTHTLYVPNSIAGTVSVIDSSICNASRLNGCGKDWPTIKVGEFPKTIVIDQATHTGYVSNYDGASVAVIDTSRCNARTSVGCGEAPLQVATPSGAYTLTLDASTHTIYVAQVDDGSVAIINAAACNAIQHTGCATSPYVVPVSDQTAGVAVDHATSTLYVTGRSGGIVSLLDTRTCNGSIHSGCSVVAISSVGTTPRFMTIAQATHTLYVANKDSDSLSMVNTATCNARDTTGCAETWPSVGVGHLPYGVRVDQRTQHLYVGELGDSTVREIDTRSCNATRHRRCARTKIVNAGGWPIFVTVDETTGTVYISDNVDAEISLARETRPRPGS